VRRLQTTIESMGLEYELIFVNDFSPDDSWCKIISLVDQQPQIKGLNLSRNFGQHQAIFAGLEHTCGKWIVVMDCDLQDRPEEIVNLYAEAQKGFDIVLARREDRNDRFIKRKFSQLFYHVLSYLTETKQDFTVANFGIYQRSVIKAVLSMADYYKYFPTMIYWVGFSKSAIRVEHAPRANGASSYTFSKLVKLAINVILTFSDKPLRLIVKLGALISLVSFAFSIYYGILYLQGKIVVMGYASLIISIWFLSGVIISFLGMVGLYLGRVYDQVKNRPNYIVKEQAGQIRKNKE
jgi:polyisoprenyl-phosphate glycosyltransferase